MTFWVRGEIMQRQMGNHIRIVFGKSGYALYDFNQKAVYHLNREAYNVIQRYLSGEDFFDKDEKEIINQLDSIKFTENLMEDDLIDISPKLTYAWLEITEVCNLNCIHCYGEWGHPVIQDKKYLNCDEWKKIIDAIYDLGCRKLQFIGGEPLACPDLQELISYAHQKGMEQVDVFTNGTLINNDLLELFKQSKVNVRVSLYGHNAELHDSITQRAGSFDKSVANINKMLNIGIPVKVAVILMRENEKFSSEIEEFISSFGSHGYDTIRQTTSGKQFNHAINNPDILSKRYQCYPDFSASRKTFELNSKWNSCWFGKVAFTSKGDIIPCIFARECILGNVRTDTKENITAKVLEMWRISKNCIESCKECEYRFACHDCRPLAKGLTGNLYSKYPRCCYDPQKGVWMDILDVTQELG